MSANVRFVWDNLGDSTSSLSATSTAGGLAAANMQADQVAAVWRSTSLAAQTLDFRWSAAQSIDSVCLAWTNLTSAATVQVKGYAEVGDVSTVFNQTVSPDTGLTIDNVTVQNWIAVAGSVKQVKVIITDAANPDGYVEVSRSIIGKRIEPAINHVTNGLRVGFVDQVKPVRAESLDLRIEPLGRFRRMQMSLDILEPASRDLILNMIANGLGRGVWVSAFPEDSTGSTRQMHSFWGALIADTDFSYPFYNNWSAPLVFEEMG